jgi:hypothetical protein
MNQPSGSTYLTARELAERIKYKQALKCDHLVPLIERVSASAAHPHRTVERKRSPGERQSRCERRRPTAGRNRPVRAAIVYAGVLSAQRKGVICLQSLGPEQTLALCSWFCIQTRGRSSPMVRAPASLARCGSLPVERNTCPALLASPRADSISTQGGLLRPRGIGHEE